MNALTPFDRLKATPFAFESHAIRVVMVDGEPWFVAKDVAEALGYTWNGLPRIEHVPEEWRGVTSVVTPSGEQNMLTLSEPGLYFFIARSDKPKALPFQKWVAGEVVPTLRKTGRYELNPAELSREQILVMALNAERERLRLEAENQQLRPKAELHDEIAQSDNEFTIRETVKILFNRAVREKELTAWLKRQGWLCQSSREPTAWAMDQGLMRLRIEEVPHYGPVKVPLLTGRGFTLLRHLYRTGPVCRQAGELFTADIPRLYLMQEVAA